MKDEELKMALNTMAGESALIAEATTVAEHALNEPDPSPVAWMLEWTCNGDERGYRLYEDPNSCMLDAARDGGVVVPLYRSPTNGIKGEA